MPRLNGDWEYMFYVDLELNPDHDMGLIKNMLDNYTTNLEVLGVYNKEINYMKVKPAERTNAVKEYYFLKS